MPNRVPWTERRFNFDFPSDLYPELIERLRGAPVRASALVADTPPERLARRDGETWSIQENIAHLADTDESLFIPRLDQYDAGAATLLPADMTNRDTWQADHNRLSIEEVLTRFAAVRGEIVTRLERQAPSYFERSATHPRLGQPMRVIDLLLFKAEHDDYHLARARDLSTR